MGRLPENLLPQWTKHQILPKEYNWEEAVPEEKIWKKHYCPKEKGITPLGLHHPQKGDDPTNISRKSENEGKGEEKKTAHSSGRERNSI